MRATKGQPSMPAGTVLFMMLAVLFGVCAPHLYAREKPGVRRITIQSYWAGFSPHTPMKTDIIIERLGDSYRMTGTRSRHEYGHAQPVETISPTTVSVAKVAALLAALRAPAQPQVDIEAIGLDTGRVQRAIDQNWERAELAHLPPAIRAKADALRESLRQPARSLSP